MKIVPCYKTLKIPTSSCDPPHILCGHVDQRQIRQLRRQKTRVRDHASCPLRKTSASKADPTKGPHQQISLDGSTRKPWGPRWISQPGQLGEPRHARDGRERREETSSGEKGAVPPSEEVRPGGNVEVPVRGWRGVHRKALPRQVRGVQENVTQTAAGKGGGETVVQLLAQF